MIRAEISIRSGLIDWMSLSLALVAASAQQFLPSQSPSTATASCIEPFNGVGNRIRSWPAGAFLLGRWVQRAHGRVGLTQAISLFGGSYAIQLCQDNTLSKAVSIDHTGNALGSKTDNSRDRK